MQNRNVLFHGRGEGRGLALIDDATSHIWGRFAEHDSTEENLHALEGWLRRYGRPVALYTDKQPVRGQPAAAAGRTTARPAGADADRAGAGRVGDRVDRSPLVPLCATRGRIEGRFGTLQDRLVKEMRLAGVQSVAQANQCLGEVVVPFWEGRFTVALTPRRDRKSLSAHGLQGLPNNRKPNTFPSRPPREEDVSIWPRTGHFYFALSYDLLRITYECRGSPEMRRLTEVS